MARHLLIFRIDRQMENLMLQEDPLYFAWQVKPKIKR